MSLFDTALQKAYRRNEPQKKSSEQRGLHFTLPQTNNPPEPSEAKTRELYVNDSLQDNGVVDLREASQDGTTRPSELRPVLSFDLHNESASEATASRTDEAAAKVRDATQWISLFRHEVSTNEPELYGWHLPSAEPKGRSLPRITPTMEVGSGQAPLDPADVERHAAERPWAIKTEVDNDPEPPHIGRAPEAFRAGWEVDRFHVNDVCERVEEALADELSFAGGQLIEACSEVRRVVTVGSWSRGEGRTTVATVLARALAANGYTVALVDGDFENPELATVLGLATGDGELTRQFSCQDVANNCVKSIHDRITFFPCAALNVVLDNRRGTLDRAAEILQQHFDVVIVDLPPGWSDACQATAGLRVVVRNTAQTPEETWTRWVSRVENLVDVPLKIIKNFTNC